MGMLAPAKPEKPINHIRWGRTGRRPSMQSMLISHDLVLSK
jgi:hypothetical protein